jgi:hypothetical protein
MASTLSNNLLPHMQHTELQGPAVHHTLHPPIVSNTASILGHNDIEVGQTSCCHGCGLGNCTITQPHVPEWCADLFTKAGSRPTAPSRRQRYISEVGKVATSKYQLQVRSPRSKYVHHPHHQLHVAACCYYWHLLLVTQKQHDASHSNRGPCMRSGCVVVPHKTTACRQCHRILSSCHQLHM